MKKNKKPKRLGSIQLKKPIIVDKSVLVTMSLHVPREGILDSIDTIKERISTVTTRGELLEILYDEFTWHQTLNQLDVIKDKQPIG